MNRTTRLGWAALALSLGWGCSSSQGPATQAATIPTLNQGEVCDPTTAPTVLVHFDPMSVVLAPGQSRPVRLVVDPDLCAPVTATFAMADGTVATAPDSAALDLRHPTYDFMVTGSAAGTTTLTVSVQRPTDASPFTGTLPVEVRPDALAPTCSSSDSQSGSLSGSSTTLSGSASVADASLSVPAGAFSRSDEWALPTFNATIGCGGDTSATAPGGLAALGPAVTFTPDDKTWLTHSLRRELDFTIPINPAVMPVGARMRHVQVLYSGPVAKTPRAITIANPSFTKLADGGWGLHFESPWSGTYQAAVSPKAATSSFKRHLTHKSVLGISMGGGASATFGMNHHDQFDMLGLLGGPSDSTWEVWYFEHYKFAGFCPVSNPNCPQYAPNLYPMNEVFAHTEDFDHWFFQPGQGTGGSWDRGGWTSVLEDFIIAGGNPNGQNADPSLPFMVTGPKATDPFVMGTVPNTNCAVTLDPVSPNQNDTAAQQAQEALDQTAEQQTQAACQASRCDPKNVWTAKTGFYDASYNPDGSRPVITFCDGGQMGTAPYVDTWAPVGAGQGTPNDFTLAVDLNGNGIRDFGEPIIRQGEEPYDDTGTDGVADAQEPGYDPLTNPDPNEDDYDFQLNPNGTENDHTWEPGEPYQDVGLDGVPNTPQQSNGGYDFGEGDGKFTLSAGAQRLYHADPHSILHGRSPTASGPVDATALARLNVWVDGGIRDMANFGVDGNHFLGAVASVKKEDGTPAKASVFYNNFENLPGADPTQANQFLPVNVLWADVPAAAHLRFGYVDATPQMIANGDGQHVGTGTQAVYRLITGFYAAGNAWPDVDRTLADSLVSDPTDPSFNGESTTVNELGTHCEYLGHCETYFTGPKTQRVGPLGITLPPGYALEASRVADKRYPVLFVLHGYGQDPRDLEATAAVTDNYMNDAQRSAGTRLSKMIVVYVDGRCRIDAVTKQPECIHGTFYQNSPRSVNGRPIAQLDDWFEEVMTYVDANYRTLGPSDVDVTE